MEAAYAEGLANRLGLDLDLRAGTLPTGNRRKLGLVLAFATRPRLLLLDEPTSRLDPLVQQEFLALVKEPRAGGATVLLSSHVLNEVQRVADRVGVLRAGRLVGEAPSRSSPSRPGAGSPVLTDAEVPADAWRDVPGLDDLSVDGTRMTATLAGRPWAVARRAAPAGRPGRHRRRGGRGTRPGRGLLASVPRGGRRHRPGRSI